MMEYYSTVMRSKLLINPTAWVELRCSLLSERSQTQKALRLPVQDIWEGGTTVTESTAGTAKGLRKGPEGAFGCWSCFVL